MAPPLSIWAHGLRRRRALRQRSFLPRPTPPHPTLLPCALQGARACSPTPLRGPLPTACTGATLPARPCARGCEHRWGRVRRGSRPRQKARTSWLRKPHCMFPRPSLPLISSYSKILGRATHPNGVLNTLLLQDSIPSSLMNWEKNRNNNGRALQTGFGEGGCGALRRLKDRPGVTWGRSGAVVLGGCVLASKGSSSPFIVSFC